MVARIGLLLPRWFWVERKNNVEENGSSCGASKSEPTVELFFPLDVYGLACLEGVDEALSVRVADLFDTNTIDNPRQCDGSCRIGETGGSVLGGGISVFGEMLDERFIGDDASLGKAVYDFADFGK
jgi:hypothetical protein